MRFNQTCKCGAQIKYEDESQFDLPSGMSERMNVFAGLHASCLMEECAGGDVSGPDAIAEDVRERAENAASKIEDMIAVSVSGFMLVDEAAKIIAQAFLPDTEKGATDAEHPDA